MQQYMTPQAYIDTLPRGLTVLSLSGTDRSELRFGLITWGALLFAAGYVVRGWVVKKPS